MFWKWIKRKFQLFISSFKKTKIKASFDEDLLEILEGSQTYEDIIRGDATCHLCNEAVSLENLAAIIKEGDGYLLICNNPSCMTNIN